MAWIQVLLLCASAARAVPAPPLEVVIYAGPHKTGSSTLENAVLSDRHGVCKLLELKDNFAIPTKVPGQFKGAKSHANIVAALVSDFPAVQESWLWLLRFARDAFAQGRSLLLASENFSSIFRLPERIKLLVMALKEVGYKTVRVILTHRRVSEKLQSEHSEQFMASHRPIRNVNAYQPIVDWIVRRDPHAEIKYMQTIAVSEAYAAVGAEASVLDLHKLHIHNETSLPTAFICEHLRAPSTCAMLRSGSMERASHKSITVRFVKKNVRPRGLALLYDLVYAAAAKSGLQQLDGVRAVAALEALNVRSRPELAIRIRCLPVPALARVWNATVAEEVALLGQPLGDAELGALRANFDVKAAGMCSADLDATLAAREWAAPIAIAIRQGTEEL
ncbi:hypothetical protein T492DRAFT_1127394 [Pavlovales sp. CCMP2436]|nr:hypothetical protein T492DRAFT_1127394 [Pavlovales sp. CCMP2436]